MESKPGNAPLVVIGGETASGKTALAIELVQRFDGEIICADSRTVYKGMDIGTAKPSAEERRLVPHHLLDIAPVDKPITVSDFKELALQTMTDITSRGKVPFLVGGTGLYIDAVIFDFKFRNPADPALRSELQSLSVQELQDRLLQAGIELPNNSLNPRHLIRQIETGGEQPAVSDLRPNTLVLVMDIDKPELEVRVKGRVATMFQQGLVDEVQKLSDLYGWDCPAMQTIGYQEFIPYFEGRVTLEEVETNIVRHTLQYAKRQRTWFRRNKYAKHICNVDDSVELITSLLNK